MKKYGKFAALVVVIVGTLIWLATAGIKDNQTYYKTIAELHQMGDQAYSKRLRVGGDISPGSIVRTCKCGAVPAGAGEAESARGV